MGEQEKRGCNSAWGQKAEGHMLMFYWKWVNEQNRFYGEVLLSVCMHRKRLQLCQCVYSAESGRLCARVCGSPAASSRTLNKRISWALGEPGRTWGLELVPTPECVTPPQPSNTFIRSPAALLMQRGRRPEEGGGRNKLPTTQTRRVWQVNLWTVWTPISLRNTLEAPNQQGLTGFRQVFPSFKAVSPLFYISTKIILQRL